MAAGRDDLARDALAADRRTEHQLDSHLEVLVDLRAREGQLQASADSLQERVEALRTTIETLDSRRSVARAHRRIDQVRAAPQTPFELETDVAETARQMSDALARAAVVGEMITSGRIDGGPAASAPSEVGDSSG